MEIQVRDCLGREKGNSKMPPTSLNGTKGGPAAISEDLVPGCIRRLEWASMTDCSISVACKVAGGPPDGEFGVIWISAVGGGLGKRGELGARAIIDNFVGYSPISRLVDVRGGNVWGGKNQNTLWLWLWLGYKGGGWCWWSWAWLASS